MVKIVHFSDWHWDLRYIPPADLYVCTGDMLDNYPIPDKTRDPWDIMGGSNWRISPENERIRQTEDVRHFVKDGGFRALLGSPDAPIVCVRGNHDFIDLAPLFQGCNLVHEFIDNELVEVFGLRVTGHRGIPWIYGSWNDEVTRPDLRERADRMPKEADLFLTHYPPAGVLDSNMPPGLSMGGGWAESYGLQGMIDRFIYASVDPDGPATRAHCFGHIHECGGRTTQVADIVFSNAAVAFNEFEIEPRR